MNILSQFTLPGILFLLTLAAGFWLSRTGKPYNTAIFTIHKLVALAAVITMGMQIIKLFKSLEAQTLVIALSLLAVLCALALFVTGALMSIGKPSSPLFLTIHQAAPLIAVGALGLIFYLLIGKQP